MPRKKKDISLNAVRHGLATAALVIPGVEDEREWSKFHDDMLASLAPEGTLESTLAMRIAVAFWRLRRVDVAARQFVVEAEARDQAHEDRLERIAARAAAAEKANFYGVLDQPLSPESTFRPARRVLPDADDLRNLDRHEAHLNRQLLHALHELEAAQQRRHGLTPPLARVDVQGLPGT